MWVNLTRKRRAYQELPSAVRLRYHVGATSITTKHYIIRSPVVEKRKQTCVHVVKVAKGTFLSLGESPVAYVEFNTD